MDPKRRGSSPYDASLPGLLSAFVSDVIGLTMGAPTGTVTQLIGKVIEKRRSEAIKVVVDELRSGEFDISKVMSPEDSVAVCLRILRSAEEGVARRNLRLMAQVINAKAGYSEVLYASEFLKYSRILESLSREEIYFLARLIYWQKNPPSPKESGSASPESLIWECLKADLVGAGSAFPDEASLRAIAASVTRTGFVVAESTWGGIIYAGSPFLAEVARLVDFGKVTEDSSGT